MVDQPVVPQTFPLALLENGYHINISPVIGDLPQSTQPFKDDREQPDNDISQLAQYPQEASCLDPWTCMGQDFSEDPWLNSLPLTLSSLNCISENKVLWDLIHEDQDKEVMEHLSLIRVLLWLNHLSHLAMSLHIPQLLTAFLPHTLLASYLCLLNTLLLPTSSYTSTHFPPICLNLLIKLLLLPSKPFQHLGPFCLWPHRSTFMQRQR